MSVNAPTTQETLLVCNCQQSMDIDGASLGRMLGHDKALPIATELCLGQQNIVTATLLAAPTGKVRIACTQEAATFRDLAQDAKFDLDRLAFTNIRERAGWSEAKAHALPKMAALLAASAIETEPTGALTLASNGLCLVIGKGQTAIDAAQKLAQRLTVTVLLEQVGDAVPPTTTAVQVAKGKLRTVSGRLGEFKLVIDGYAPLAPSSRGALAFERERNNAQTTCDLIVDLSGGPALFQPGARREGYLRADPGDRAAISEALFLATDLVGEFEKPIYVRMDNEICAHARSGKVGCRNCLDVCPTGAIAPQGNHVVIDPAICAGCGTCAAVCPTGAVSYAYPSRTDTLRRSDVLLKTYLDAGGQRPVLLLHDETHGTPIIAALARYGKGLPANVLPLAVHAVTAAGHDLFAAALALGAEHVILLSAPQHADEAHALDAQITLLHALLQGLGYDHDRVRTVVTSDPDELAMVLDTLPRPEKPTTRAPFALRGTKRDLARVALGKLNQGAPAPREMLALPKGAPYGRIAIKSEGCTLCLACVGACPANALSDHPERPQVALTEAACVQCGVCVATCPEKVITLEPRYDFTPRALTPEILHKEDPFACIECGKPFGTQSTIKRIVAKLEGKHGMFKNPEQVRLIQMCDTCRVVTVSKDGNDPYKVGARPLVRTTEDYLKERAANVAAKKPPTPDDFLT